MTLDELLADARRMIDSQGVQQDPLSRVADIPDTCVPPGPARQRLLESRVAGADGKVV
jgi:hypothetical protein